MEQLRHGPLPPGSIPLTPIGAPRGAGPRETHRLFILASVGLAVFGGFLLAILLPLGRALGWGWEAKAPDLAHVHGQIQVLGFAGLFVLGMALRLLPRFSRAELRFAFLVVPALGLTVGALVLRALVVVWLPEGLHGALTVGFQAVLLLAAVGFAAVIVGTLLRPNQADVTGWFFLGGAFFLVVQGIAGLFIALDEAGDGTRVFAFLPNAALLYLQLTGFILSFVGGVSGRALPSMVGLDRKVRAGKVVALALATAVTVLAAALFWLEYVEFAEMAVRLAGAALVGLGFVFLAVVWLTGVFQPRADRLRPASRPHFLHVRAAFGWLCFAAGLALFYGADGVLSDGLPDQFQVDALRHVLAAGVITNLIVGMAFMIVPEFAGERFDHPDQAQRSYLLFALLNAAAVLRVAPALAGFSWAAETRGWSMAAAGLCAETALVVFAWNFVRLARSARL